MNQSDPGASAIAAGEGTFFGYASRFGREDMTRDLVLPGAFSASIARRGCAGIRMLYQHDPAEPVGIWEDIREDSHGLYVHGRLLGNVARGRDVLALLRAGALDGLSIGFRTVRARKDAATGARHLIEVDLWEISIVTFPLLPSARIASVKGLAGTGSHLVGNLQRARKILGGAFAQPAPSSMPFKRPFDNRQELKHAPRSLLRA